MLHYIFTLLFALGSSIAIETSFQPINIELNKKKLKPEVPLHKVPLRKLQAKEIPKINITPCQDIPVGNIHVADFKKILRENIQKRKEEHILTDEQEAEREAYAIFILRQQMAAHEQFKHMNSEEYQQKIDAKIQERPLSLEDGGIFTLPLRVGITILQSIKKSFTTKPKQKKENLPACLKTPNEQDLSLYLKMLEEESDKTKYIHWIKELIKKDLSKEIDNYNIELDNTQVCIYKPTSNINPSCVYIPAQNNNPAHIYVPSKNDNPHCFYIPTEQEKNDLILSSVPVIVIAGGGAGGVIGGILSGPAIPIITVGIGIGFLIKGIKDSKNKSNSDGGGGGGGNNNNKKNDDDDDEEKKRKQKEAEKFKIEHPNGRYEPSAKHHKNSPEGIGKAPIDGQKILDKSIGTDTEKWRVGIENGKFVIFEKTSQGVYHGYVVENPGNMHQSIKNAVYNAGWVKAINNLKIIKK